MNKLFNNLFDNYYCPWSKAKATEAPLFEEGQYLVEGDSNIRLTNVKIMIHKNSFNISGSGETPADVIKQFPFILKRHKIAPIKKAYVQIGANLWTWHTLSLPDFNLPLYQKEMKEIIELYKTILPACDIIIGSLPFVYPKINLNDMAGDDYSSLYIQAKLKKIKINDVFKIANISLKNICEDAGVKYLDIFLILQTLWKIYGKKFWFDKAHYGYECQAVIGDSIRTFWRV